MTIEHEIGNLFYNARKEIGLTQCQVAEAVMISVRWYQLIETGRKILSTRLYIRIRRFLNIITDTVVVLEADIYV